MQMCMRPSVPRPPVLAQKGASGLSLCKYSPYGSMDGNNNADGHHMAGVRIRVRVSIVAMLWRVMVVYVIAWQ